MRREPKTQDHPKAAYLIGLFVVLMALFVLAGVIHHLGFSEHGPGLLRPLADKWQGEEEEKEEMESAKALAEPEKPGKHQRFHHTVQALRVPEEFRSTCLICHTYLPHDKTEHVRAMLNMHSNVMACETCHLKIEEDEMVVYRWSSPLQSEDPEGPFYGTAYHPETGELIEGGSPYARITPFYRKNGKLVSAIHTRKAEEARGYMAKRDQLSKEQRKEAAEEFHLDTDPKGPECHTCHSEKSIFDLQKLGFSAQRVEDLENLSIKGLITRYDKFYIPNLFEKPEITGSGGTSER